MPSPLLVQLPSEIQAKARSVSVKLDSEFELRDNNRIPAFVEAELRVIQTPLVIRSMNPDDPNRTNAIAIVKDLSRTGIGFFYHVQLYPQEVIEVFFSRRLVTAKIVRCRYVADACFEVGGIVLSVKSL